ncbi:hypothetical protein TeGR_g10511 [Tetraparma gracilis]|uniref:Uncharacterized protein n=1 Tax=Tetraparma gracilis TaxID=2962635 RepID=A0ABQ6M7A2_9STRA|nr:hypothetical protein TeGR_g10511 [Tetraparma gracilis]
MLLACNAHLELAGSPLRHCVVPDRYADPDDQVLPSFLLPPPSPTSPPFHFVVSPSSPSDLLLLSKLSKLSPSAPLVHLNPPSPLPPPISLPVSLSSASGVPAASAFVLAALRLTNLGRSLPLLVTRVAPDPLYSVWALPEKAGAGLPVRSLARLGVPRLMRKKYRSTFWSMETGNEWVQSYFIQGGRDEMKKNILEFNTGKWKAIEPQVKEWVREGWMGWARDKPDWFTDNWKSRVPADWVPTEGKADHKRARESERRMSFGGSDRKRSIIYAAA